MKKTSLIICVLLCAVLFTTLFAACQESETTYYGKTYTLTGAGLSVDWDDKIWTDPLETSPGLNPEKYSSRELLEKYWDDIDWQKNGINAIPQNVDQLISHIEQNVIPTFYEEMKGLKLEVGTKDNLTLKVTYPSDKGFGTTLTIDKLTEIKNSEGRNATYKQTVPIGEENYEYSGYLSAVINHDGKESVTFGVPWKNIDDNFVESNPSTIGNIALKAIKMANGATYVYNLSYMVYPEVEIA